MKLSAIEAIRYGALEGACLDGLGDGLTVVLGPNESGKSTMTALTRHVLYGYPDGRSKERGYAPATGPRAARLVFRDESGEWAVERVDGKNRGPVSVTARAGAERTELLSELVGGVSEQSYRVVFGFGLDELAEIEKGDNAEIVARLYAAGFGLAVNPMDARKRLEAAAGELYAPRASKPLVNTIAAKLRDVKLRIGELESQAAEYAGDQARLAALAEQLEPLRARQDALDAQLLVLEQDALRLAELSDQREALAARLAELDRAVTDSGQAIEMTDVNEAVLAAAPELTVVLDDASGFRARVEASNAAQAAADESLRRARAIGVPQSAVDSAENRSAVDAAAGRLASLQAKAEATEDAARQLEARAQATQAAAEAVVLPAAPASSRLVPVALSAIIAVVGAVFVALGLLQSQVLIAGLGGLVAVGGVAALLVALLRKPDAPATNEQALSIEAARMVADATAARSIANGAGRDAEVARAEWRVWLVSRGLDSQGDDPAAVRALLDQAAERQRLHGEAEAHASTAAREREAAEAWVVRLVDAVRRYDGAAAQIPPLSEATTLAERARHDLSVARAAAEERAKLARELEGALAERQRTAADLEQATTVVATIIARHGLADTDALPALTVLLNRARTDRVEGRDQYESLAREHATLQGRLNNEGRGDAMARARQELESLRVQAAQEADRYVVAMLSVHLVDRARERYERERQPEVVKTAGRVFSAMTGGRYVGVRVPLDNSGITVLTAEGGVRSTAELSRGTAEQLYLALRVGLIGSLGATGTALPVLMDDVVVNFDPERRAGAMAAVAELAKLRQVLFFTCHPETADALVDAIAGSTLRSLDRCQLR